LKKNSNEFLGRTARCEMKKWCANSPKILFVLGEDGFVRVERGNNTIAVETMVETADVVEDAGVKCRIAEFVGHESFEECSSNVVV
jgi:hypothetical protein